MHLLLLTSLKLVHRVPTYWAVSLRIDLSFADGNLIGN